MSESDALEIGMQRLVEDSALERLRLRVLYNPLRPPSEIVTLCAEVLEETASAIPDKGTMAKSRYLQRRVLHEQAARFRSVLEGK
jgi:hypothetical protein